MRHVDSVFFGGLQSGCMNDRCIIDGLYQSRGAPCPFISLRVETCSSDEKEDK